MRGPTKRLFVAALVPAEVEQHLGEHIDGVRVAHPELRWVPSARWHLTFEFLGDVGPHERARQSERWARRAARVEPFEIRLSSAGAFPHGWSARVLWVGLAGETTSFTRLAAHGQAPHVTVARSRQAADLTGLVDELASYAGPAWTVDEIAVVESHLRSAGERGPRYEPLEFFGLGR